MPEKFSLRTIFLVLFLLLAVIGLSLTVFLAQKRQETRKKAAVPEGQATVFLSPSSGTYPVGQPFSTSIAFNTAAIPISGIALRLTYSYSGATPELTASDLQISPSLLATGDWSCPVKTITPEGGTVKIDVACVNINIQGFSTSTETALASFNLRAGQIPATNPTIIRFDPSQSIITRKSDGQDILLLPSSTGSYTIAPAGATATPTPGPTATPTPFPTATPTPIATSTPVPTPTPSATTGNLLFKIKFQGISSQKLNQGVRVILKQQGEEKYRRENIEVTSGQNGVYSGAITNINPGTYDLFLKGWSHLQKKFSNINLATGANSQDFSRTELLAGDTTGDNKINAQDIVILVQHYRPNTPPNSPADFNLDGIVNAQDVRFLVENYRQQGEQ